MRTLLETKRSAARPTAIVARELDRYNIDIAALSETRILGETVIQETGGGYTFFLKGKPDGDKHHHGVGFAIRTKLVLLIQAKYSVGINERLMTMSLSLVLMLLPYPVVMSQRNSSMVPSMMPFKLFHHPKSYW